MLIRPLKYELVQIVPKSSLYDIIFNIDIDFSSFWLQVLEPRRRALCHCYVFKLIRNGFYYYRTYTHACFE